MKAMTRRRALTTQSTVAAPSTSCSGRITRLSGRMARWIAQKMVNATSDRMINSSVTQYFGDGSRKRNAR